jgi:hypothetical protein
MHNINYFFHIVKMLQTAYHRGMQRFIVKVMGLADEKHFVVSGEHLLKRDQFSSIENKKYYDYSFLNVDCILKPLDN